MYVKPTRVWALAAERQISMILTLLAQWSTGEQARSFFTLLLIDLAMLQINC